MANDIWSVADLLRGDYKRHEYGQVILPFTLLRRLDAVMAPTRDAVRARNASLEVQNKDRLLELAAKLPFYNTSDQDFASIASDAPNVAKNLRDYINGFSPNVRKILSRFDLDNEITRLAGAKILYKVVGKFNTMRDLDKLSNHDMGYVFEHLIRKFAEDSNETAGEHFTPREVIKLMVNLLIAPDAETIAGEGQVINILDPACGTGGMLTAAEDHIKSINPQAKVYLFGQELNAESWAICQADMLMRNQPGRIHFGNSFSDDGYPDQKFDYMLANPPFGVEWKKVKDEVEAEAEIGHAGRFGVRAHRGGSLDRQGPGSFGSSSNTCSRRWNPSRARGPAWASSSTVRRSSRERPSPASRRSGRWILLKTTAAMQHFGPTHLAQVLAAAFQSVNARKISLRLPVKFGTSQPRQQQLSTVSSPSSPNAANPSFSAAVTGQLDVTTAGRSATSGGAA
ncbi:hypothetical protein SBADM41S_05528 [Streptomyces badius]